MPIRSVVAAGGSGVYTIQNINNPDYIVSGNITLSNALTLATTCRRCAFRRRRESPASGANPAISINGGGTTTKAVYLYGNNSTTFTGNIIITNAGGFKSANASSLSSANTVFMDSTAFFDNGSLNLTIAGLNNYGGGGGTVAAAGGSGISLTLGGGGSYLFGGVINNSGGIVKSGSGQQILSGVNLYTGPTVVNSGTLLVNGSLASGSTVTVSGGRFGGTGTINGPTTVNAGAVLAAGNNGIGTLTFNNNLTLNAASTNSFNVTTAGGVSNKVAVAGTYGGHWPTALSGTSGSDNRHISFVHLWQHQRDNFQHEPGIRRGSCWNRLRCRHGHRPDGTLRGRLGVNLTPTNIMTSVSGNVLTLSWPADHTGWRLLMQTNHLAAGLSANTNDWVTVPGSAGIHQTNITMNLALPTEFYRLVYP